MEPSDETPDRGDRPVAGQLLLKGDCDFGYECEGESLEEPSPRLGDGLKVLAL